MRRNTDWLAEGKFGMMVHFIPAVSGNTDTERTSELNRLVNGFDIDRFMCWFEDFQADWLIFTLGQNTCYYSCPNAVLDSVAPGHTSDRDLVTEIATRVKGLGKHFIAYLPGDFDSKASEVLRPMFDLDNDSRACFQKPYQDFMRAFSDHLGKLADAWWMDGICVPENKPADWKGFYVSLRSGNPDTLIAPSPCPSFIPMEPNQDYIAGEVYRLKGWRHWGENLDEEPVPLPTSRFVDGVQWHALLPIDESFTPDKEPSGPGYYSDDELVEWINACNSVGGAVTLDMHIHPDSSLYPETIEQVKRVRNRL